MPNRPLEIKIWQSSAPPVWKLVLQGMVSFMPDENAETFYAEPAKLASRLGWSKRQVQRYLAELETHGLLVRCGGGNWRGRVVWRIPVDRLAQGDIRDTLRRVTFSAHRVTSNACRVTSKPGFSPPSPPLKQINTNKTICARDAHACSLSGDQKTNPWDAIKSDLREQVNPHSFGTWFAPAFYSHVEGRTIVVSVPTPEFADLLSERYGQQIRAALERDSNGFEDVSFVLRRAA